MNNHNEDSSFDRTTNLSPRTVSVAMESNPSLVNV
jgi:hypothetical protein